MGRRAGTNPGTGPRIEPDLSNAAPFVALAAVTGGSVTVRDWPPETTQAGDALREILTAMGCSVAYVDDGLRVTGPDRLQGVASTCTTSAS